MGPGDPFAGSTSPASEQTDAIPDTLPEQSTMIQAPVLKMKELYILGGLLLGILFGIGLLVWGWIKMLLILTCGAIGAFIAWAVYEITSGNLDFGGAWRALRNK